jgi:hypothetical protein
VGKSNDTKQKLLGMPAGTAAGRLRKIIMFSLLYRLNENICYRCKEAIATVAELSIEHKDAWQGAADPVAAFFDLDNISFSHHACNVGAASRPTKIYESRGAQRAAGKLKHNAKYGDRYNKRRRIARLQAKVARVAGVEPADLSFGGSATPTRSLAQSEGNSH